VLSDTGHCTNLFATRADVLIPHACLGATMSGLLSRTVADRQLADGGGFHGVACYGEWTAQDLSNCYLDTIASRFAKVRNQVRRAVSSAHTAPPPDERGRRHASVLARQYGADDLHLVNIGMSESTRGFFRRLPLLLLVHPAAQHAVRHLLQIADERQVAVRQEPGMPFKAALI
jgi:Phosphoribosyl transferase (PRTase)/PELOTA RNA binding domain